MDRLIIDYLKGKGKSDMSEQEFKHRFKDFMTRYRRDSMGRYDKEWYPMERMDDYYRHGRPGEFVEHDFEEWHDKHRIDDEEMYNMIKYMRHSMTEEGHFNESEARYIVSQMYHIENGRKHTGEKFDMHKAKEIVERYRGILPTSVTPADVYVAINTQYHDYAELFKTWFGDNIDQKIIESAIVFWFKDADCKAENKVVEYLKEY